MAQLMNHIKPLPNVIVKLRDISFLWWKVIWKGTTDESGKTEEVTLTWGFLYKVTVSKCNYHTYGNSYEMIPAMEFRRYDVYFTMAEDGSPFVYPDVTMPKNKMMMQSPFWYRLLERFPNIFTLLS